MSTTTTEQAVVLTTGNKVEIIRASTVRRLVWTKAKHQLVILGERGEPMIVTIDAAPFLQEYEHEYGRCDDEATHQALVAAAFFRAVLEGKTVKVLSREAVPAELTA